MSQTPEAKVKARIREVLDAVGAVYSQPIGSSYGRSDMCDFIVCLPDGKYLEIEAKAYSYSNIRPNQIKKIDRVRDIGGLALVIHQDNLHDLIELIAQARDVRVREVEARIQVHREAKAAQKKAKRQRRVIAMKEEE